MEKDSHAERIEQTGKNTMLVEHDDGSKFECNFIGKFPDKAREGPPATKVMFNGIGDGTGSIKEWRKKLGLD